MHMHMWCMHMHMHMRMHVCMWRVCMWHRYGMGMRACAYVVTSCLFKSCELFLPHLQPGHNDICDAADPGDERRPCNGHSSGRNMWWDDGEMLLGPWDSDEWRDQEGHPQARAVCVGADAPLGAAA
jgi:hypothetical protein